MKKHNIKIIDINNYKHWIDISYDDFNVLIKKINRKNTYYI